MNDALTTALGVDVTAARLLAGGASKEAWAVETADGRTLVVRRALGGVIHADTLSLRDEFDMLVAARDAGVCVAQPIRYLGSVDGREAFATEFVPGETIGRRIVRDPPPGLADAMAEQLALIHAIDPATVPFLSHAHPIDRLTDELATVGGAHPAIEYGIAWCRARLPLTRAPVVVHGDFRVGNLVVRDGALAGVLDWEFARLADPLEELAWPLVRAWRFGADDRRVGGVGDPEDYVRRYEELTGRTVPRDELRVWEVFGNCTWAVGARRQAQRHLDGEQRSVELAILGRLAVEMEWELLDLIDRIDGVDPEPSAPVTVTVAERPSARELTAAVREYLESEVLPDASDPRARFRVLVAMNALAIAERGAPAPSLPDPATAALARRLRAGDLRAGDRATLKADVVARLRLASPAFLQQLVPE